MRCSEVHTTTRLFVKSRGQRLLEAIELREEINRSRSPRRLGSLAISCACALDSNDAVKHRACTQVDTSRVQQVHVALYIIVSDIGSSRRGVCPLWTVRSTTGSRASANVEKRVFSVSALLWPIVIRAEVAFTPRQVCTLVTRIFAMTFSAARFARNYRTPQFFTNVIY